MTKKRGLGRGMESVFADNSIETSESGSGAIMLRLSQIEPNPDQPRHEFDTQSLAELADSISNHGLIQPITVRPSENGFYTIIAGERRWRASKMAGLSEVPVIIMDVDDKKAAELALIENIQREDLNPIEEAKAYKSLIDEYGLTQEQAASRVGKSRVAVTNSMRLLDLPDEILDMISAHKLSAGHARALLGLKNKSELLPLAELISASELSVRAVEEKIRKLNSAKPEQISEDPQKAEYYKVLESRITAHLGNKVAIRRNSKNKSISIAFDSSEELEDIITRLCGKSIFDEIG